MEKREMEKKSFMLGEKKTAKLCQNDILQFATNPTECRSSIKV